MSFKLRFITLALKQAREFVNVAYPIGKMTSGVCCEPFLPRSPANARHYDKGHIKEPSTPTRGQHHCCGKTPPHLATHLEIKDRNVPWTIVAALAPDELAAVRVSGGDQPYWLHHSDILYL